MVLKILWKPAAGIAKKIKKSVAKGTQLKNEEKFIYKII
jgi:hypothetical protein